MDFIITDQVGTLLLITELLDIKHHFAIKEILLYLKVVLMCQIENLLGLTEIHFLSHN